MDGYTPFDADSDNTNGNSSGLEFAAAPSFLDGSGNGNASGNDSGEFDPAIHIGRDKRNADGSYRRKRGRKSNSASSGNRKASSGKASLDAFTVMLSMVHIGLSSATKCPELRLEEQEAQALAFSGNAVLEEFGIEPDSKVVAVMGLVTTASMIYGPRIYLISERRKQEKKNANE